MSYTQSSVQNDLHELEGLMDSWMTRSPAKPSAVDSLFGLGGGPSTSGGGSYKSPRSERFYSDEYGTGPSGGGIHAAVTNGAAGVDHHGDDFLANYVVSKVSGRPVQLPPVRQLMGKSRKVYGYQEPSMLMKKNKESRGNYQDDSERNIRDLGFGRSQFQREVDRHSSTGKSGWKEGPSSGIPGLNQLPPKNRRGDSVGRSNTTSRAPSSSRTLGRSTAPVGGARGNPSRLPPMNPTDLRQNGAGVRKPLTAGAQTRSKAYSRYTRQQQQQVPLPNRVRSSSRPTATLVVPAVMTDPKVDLERCLVEKSLLLEKAAIERSQRSNLTRRSAALAAQIDDAMTNSSDFQSEAQKLDTAVKKLQARALAAAKQVSNLRQKDKQLKELKSMHRVAAKRLNDMSAEEMRADAPIVMLNPEVINVGDAETVRKNTKNQESLKEQYRELTTQRNELVSEVNRLEAKDKERNRTTKDMVGKMEREKHLAKLEIERKGNAELQKEISRIRDNFEKVQRHRQREIKAKNGDMNAEVADLQSKMTSIQQTGTIHGKELAQLLIKVELCKTEVDVARNVIRDLDDKIHTTVTHNEKLKARRQTAGKEQRTASKELELLRAQPSNSIAPLEAEASKERKEFNEEFSRVASKQKQILAEISQAEDELEGANSELHYAEHQKTSVPQGASSNSSQVADVEKEISQMKADIKKIKADTKSLLDKFDIESKSKDSIIESKTRSIGTSKSQFKSLNAENTKLLEQLDGLERMAGMNGVSA